MLRFSRFVQEEVEHKSEYADPKSPQHDLWKHGRPALRHNHTGHVIIGKRGEAHHELTDNEGEYKRGIYHSKEKKFYRCGSETHIDSTDLMTARQRLQKGY